jgi:hypothetical protein
MHLLNRIPLAFKNWIASFPEKHRSKVLMTLILFPILVLFEDFLEWTPNSYRYNISSESGTSWNTQNRRFELPNEVGEDNYCESKSRLEDASIVVHDDDHNVYVEPFDDCLKRVSAEMKLETMGYVWHPLFKAGTFSISANIRGSIKTIEYQGYSKIVREYDITGSQHLSGSFQWYGTCRYGTMRRALLNHAGQRLGKSILKKLREDE